MFTIKQLTDAVGHGMTPRMVRHYHQIGLLPPPRRSDSNYRLYSAADVQRLKQIALLKSQGFQLVHIKQMLAAQPTPLETDSLMLQLQSQYQKVVQQLVQLRQTATALEGLIGRDRQCQTSQADALTQLRMLAADTQTTQTLSADMWPALDAAVLNHPESFHEALQRLMPDLSHRPEIEVDVIAHLILACGDVSLAAFLRFSHGAIKAARDTLSRGGSVICDVPTITAALDQPRLAHLSCQWQTLIEDAHISSANEAEWTFWQQDDWQHRLNQMIDGNVWVVGYAPSVLIKLCDAITRQQGRPALIIGCPIGFSHAPAAKRQLMQLDIPHITIAGSLGGGLLAATILNRLAASLIEKPDCHCYLNSA
jgi:precorrin-8X/cobalt-precorrin-8 methylmutase